MLFFKQISIYTIFNFFLITIYVYIFNINTNNIEYNYIIVLDYNFYLSSIIFYFILIFCFIIKYSFFIFNKNNYTIYYINKNLYNFWLLYYSNILNILNFFFLKKYLYILSNFLLTYLSLFKYFLWKPITKTYSISGQFLLNKNTIDSKNFKSFYKNNLN